MDLKEGCIGRAKTGEDLIYPGIISCLAITVVLDSNERCGGHAVLVPEKSQHNLTQILEGVAKLIGKDRIKQILVIGDVGTWDENWESLKDLHGIPQNCGNLKDYICRKLILLPVTLKDTEKCWQGGTFDVKFLKEGIIEVEKHDPKKSYVIGDYRV